ncbi:MAG TPA: L,D-transpeptidase family protein [Candidatus Gemmiger faecigallinarum]|nr:L,D-transpeptidase family protein [Candidatus Gemmiger faecigallinarum]
MESRSDRYASQRPASGSGRAAQNRRSASRAEPSRRVASGYGAPRRPSAAGQPGRNYNQEPSGTGRGAQGRPLPPDGDAARRARAKSAARRRARRRAARIRLALCLLVVAACVAGTVWALNGGLKIGGTTPPGSQGAGTSGDPAQPAGADASSVAQATPTPTPVETAEQRIAEATARNADNATLNAIQATDPDTWQSSADAILSGLQSEFSELDLTVREGFPYLITVNREAGVVTVYASDGGGTEASASSEGMAEASGSEARYTRPYMSMVCSGGPATPTGVYETPVNYQWRLLEGPCYGQYATRIWESFLFHSVPYYTQHKDDLEYVEFNKLGTQASLGCIRLMTVDVKWIYDNCPIGTTVVIYDDADTPGPMGTPGTIYIDPEDETLRGWDPTDPDRANPWDDKYLTGTTIRSAEAWAEWDAAQADGRWQQSINPADLQGYSTDYKSEGTRG